MKRYIPLLSSVAIVIFLSGGCSSTKQEPPEVSQINSMVDSLKRITTMIQNVPYPDNSGNRDILLATESGSLISYKESSATAYYGSDGNIILVEITNWDAVNKNTQYLEQYYLKENKPFYFRKFAKTPQDSTLVEAGATSVIPETWNIRLITRDDMQNAVKANSLNFSNFEGKWFEVTETLGDKRYELTRLCDAEPFNITIDAKSILINHGQTATRYSVVSTAKDELNGNLKLTTLDSLSGSTDTIEFIVAPGEAGILVLFFQNDERKVLVNENAMVLVSIKEDRSGCE
jgi:hypothetical protein